MIEKFDLTRLICMGGNMNYLTYKESQRLKLLIQENPQNVNCFFEQARFYADCDDDINTLISYCQIIEKFNCNVLAFEELAKYLYFHNDNQWAIDTCLTGLKYHRSKILEETLILSMNSIIER